MESRLAYKRLLILQKIIRSSWRYMLIRGMSGGVPVGGVVTVDVRGALSDSPSFGRML